MKETLIEKEHLLLAPYQGKKEDYVIKSMKKRMKCLLPTGNVTKSAYVDNKLSIPNVNIIITLSTRAHVPKLIIMIIT